ncbi:MAG: MFS transporter [Fimbriimonas sp.]
MTYSAILRIKPFRDLWLGQAISQLGDAFYYVVFMYMVERLTGSIAMVGVVGGLETLPFLLFGPHAGILADRIDRRKIMLLSDLVSGATLAMLAAYLLFDSKPPLALLLITPFMLSSVRVFFMPAKSAAVPALVPVEHVQKANAFSMVTQSFMPIIGLSLSATVLGILYDQTPRWFFFTAVLINALSFFGSAVYIARLPKILPEREDIHEVRPMTDFKEGMRFIGRRHDLLVLMALLTVFRFMVAPFFVVYVAANKQWFGGKPQPLAWFELAFFVGMIIASFIVGALSLKKPGLCFSMALAVVGVAVGMLGAFPSFWLFILWNTVAGLAVPFGDIPIGTYMQLSVPDAFRGRVNSVIQMISTGVMPISMGLAGLLVAGVGVVWCFYLMGAGMMLAALVPLLDPVYRRIEMPEMDTAPKVEEEPEPVHALVL